MSYRLDFIEYMLKENFSKSTISTVFLDVIANYGYILNQIKYNHSDQLENSNVPLKCLEIFLNYGFEINQIISNGITPLIFAVIKNDLNIIKFLVENGADINFTNEKGETPLMKAIKKIISIDIIDYLMSESDLSKVDSQGNTNLHIACIKINSNNFLIRKNVIERLINYGIDINSQNKNGESPLHKLCEYIIKSHSKEHTEIMNILLNSGASTSIAIVQDIKTKRYLFPKGSTPLDIIKIKNAREIEKVLINY